MAVTNQSHVERTPTPWTSLPDRDRSPRWTRGYLRRAAVADTVAVLSAALIARVIRFGVTEAELSFADSTISYTEIALACVPLWLLIMASVGCYDRRAIGAGNEEYRRILKAGLFAIAGVSVVNFVINAAFARTFVATAILLAVAGSLFGRYVLRQRLHARRVQDIDIFKTLLVGTPSDIARFSAHLRSAPWAGYSIVGACSTDPDEPVASGKEMIHVVGGIDDLQSVIDPLDADTVIVVSPSFLEGGALRELAWALEGTGVALIVAPAVTDIAGPRIVSRPVAGLPLLHVEEPRLSTPARLLKRVFDLIAATGLIVVMSPVMLITAIAVATTSDGPILFRQKRVGKDGKLFEFVKFRSMVCDAEARRGALDEDNEVCGPMFKVRDDPRMTRVGRFIRRFSIDELPQLFHVLRGRMSLVGPRPPIPTEVDAYDDHVHRRFLVKPGITGLWQVSGRSDLDWDETVHLDLFYVDHWSLIMDVTICLKTLMAVFGGRGAY